MVFALPTPPLARRLTIWIVPSPGEEPCSGGDDFDVGVFDGRKGDASPLDGMHVVVTSAVLEWEKVPCRFCVPPIKSGAVERMATAAAKPLALGKSSVESAEGLHAADL